MSTQHTPCWTAEEQYQSAERVVKTGRSYIRHHGTYVGEAESSAAVFIVRACNTNDELLTVLRRVQPHLEGQRDRHAKLGLDAAFEDYENLIQAARAAIAKAEGQS